MSSTLWRRVFVAVAAVIVVGGAVFAGVKVLGGDDDVEPLTTGDDTTTSTPSPSPTASATTTTPTPKKTEKVECEGPDTVFNEEGVRQDSLLPDCGTAPVSAAEQKKDGLSLACGGSYPVILYKTTTTGAKTSICGKDSSGVSFRFVTKPTGGDTLDLKGEYDPQLDAFVATKDGVTYAVQAYDGSLLVKKDGSTTTQKSSDWISLDNESDYD